MLLLRCLYATSTLLLCCLYAASTLHQTARCELLSLSPRSSAAPPCCSHMCVPPQSARVYFYSLLCVGFFWCSFSYYDTMQTNHKQSDADGGTDEDDEDMFFSALFASLLTVLIWLMCFYRAYLYQRDLAARDDQEAAAALARQEAGVDAERDQEIIMVREQARRAQEERIVGRGGGTRPGTFL